MAESIKEEVRKIADSLDENADWEDVMYTLYVRESIQKGKKDVKKSNIISHEDIKVRYNLK